MDTSQQRAHRAWRSAERIKRLSDRVVGIGPLGIGLDGVLAWVPGAGPLYSVGAGGLLIYEALKGGASRVTVAKMGLLLAADSAMSAVPFVGWTADVLFPGHLLAAKALQKDIEQRHGKADMAPARIRPMRDITPPRAAL